MSFKDRLKKIREEQEKTTARKSDPALSRPPLVDEPPTQPADTLPVHFVEQPEEDVSRGDSASIINVDSRDLEIVDSVDPSSEISASLDFPSIDVEEPSQSSVAFESQPPPPPQHSIQMPIPVPEQLSQDSDATPVISPPADLLDADLDIPRMRPPEERDTEGEDVRGVPVMETPSSERGSSDSVIRSAIDLSNSEALSNGLSSSRQTVRNDIDVFLEELQLSSTTASEKHDKAKRRLTEEINGLKDQEHIDDLGTFTTNAKLVPSEQRTPGQQRAIDIERLVTAVNKLQIEDLQNEKAESQSLSKGSFDAAFADDEPSQDSVELPRPAAAAVSTRPVRQTPQETPTRPKMMVESEHQEAPASIQVPAKKAGFFRRLFGNPVTWLAGWGAANIGAIAYHEFAYGDVTKIFKAPLPVVMGVTAAVLGAVYGVTEWLRRSSLRKHAKYLEAKDRELENDPEAQEAVDYLVERLSDITKNCRTPEAKEKNILEELSNNEYTFVRMELLEKKDLLHKVLEEVSLEDEVVVSFPELFEEAETAFVMTRLERLVQQDNYEPGKKVYENEVQRRQALAQMCSESPLFTEKFALIFKNKEVYERFEDQVFGFEKGRKQTIMPTLLKLLREDYVQLFPGGRGV